MSRGPNPLKLVEWIERIERFDSQDQTVAQFCAAEGVSPPSFYQWKKRLTRQRFFCCGSGSPVPRASHSAKSHSIRGPVML